MTNNFSFANKDANESVRRLRLQKLKLGLSFMINVPELAVGYCYLEFPDGRIVLATLLHHARDFNIIRELPEKEKIVLRAKYNHPAYTA